MYSNNVICDLSFLDGVKVYTFMSKYIYQQLLSCHTDAIYS